MYQKRVLLILGLVLVSVSLAACRPVASTPQSPNSGTASETPVSMDGDDIADNEEITEIVLEAGSFYYKPNEIKVKQGQKVRIVMTSKDMIHDFNIEGLGVTIPVTPSGQTNSVEFIADQKGSFTFYCSFPGHRAGGQTGTLIVE